VVVEIRLWLAALQYEIARNSHVFLDQMFGSLRGEFVDEGYGVDAN
jgi:hypothetical protein